MNIMYDILLPAEENSIIKYADINPEELTKEDEVRLTIKKLDSVKDKLQLPINSISKFGFKEYLPILYFSKKEKNINDPELKILYKFADMVVKWAS